MEKTLNIATLTSTARSAAVLNAAPRVADLRFESQKEREAIIAADAYANFLVEGYSAAKVTQLDKFLEIGFVLPQEGSHPWIVALKRVRQRLRLSVPIHVVMVLQEELIGRSYIGIRHEAGIHLIVGPSFLEDATETELAYHFGVAIWKASNEISFAYREILRRNCPLEWGLKETILEWGRFSIYSAACYGLLACGDLNTAITESWRHCLSRRAPLDAKGLLTLSESYNDTGHMAPLHLCEHFLQSGVYLVGLPQVLKNFAESAIYLDLVGKSGGTSREAFQMNIDELDKKLYEVPSPYGVEFIQFLFHCGLLVRAHVFQGSPNYSLEALFKELEGSLWDLDSFMELTTEIGLGPEGSGDCLVLLRGLKQSEFGWFIPQYANNFIFGCFQILAREAVLNPDYQPRMTERLKDVLQLCEVEQEMAELLMDVWANEAEAEEGPSES